MVTFILEKQPKVGDTFKNVTIPHGGHHETTNLLFVGTIDEQTGTFSYILDDKTHFINLNLQFCCR